MIFYFSGTGNSEHVARMIAKRTGEKLVNISDAMRDLKFYYNIAKDERIGFVYPVYYWGLPSIVKDFIRELDIKRFGKHFTYSVATCGVLTGSADEDLAKMLKRKGMPLHATFAVRMVDNYTLVFDVKNKEKNAKKNEKAEETIDDMLFLVDNKMSGYYNHCRGLWPASPIAHAMYKASRKTAFFKVSDDCIGCGKCAKDCPMKAISVEYGKPVWRKKNCTMCLSCLHHCPKNAIKFGPTTKMHGQYVYEETEKGEE